MHVALRVQKSPQQVKAATQFSLELSRSHWDMEFQRERDGPQVA